MAGLRGAGQWWCWTMVALIVNDTGHSHHEPMVMYHKAQATAPNTSVQHSLFCQPLTKYTELSNYPILASKVRIIACAVNVHFRGRRVVLRVQRQQRRKVAEKNSKIMTSIPHPAFAYEAAGGYVATILLGYVATAHPG